jgi:hypothetical protein
MTITANVSTAAELLRFANGSHINTGGTTAFSRNLGFVPRYILVHNETDRISFEWYEGQTSGHMTQTVAAGTRSLETSGGPTVSGTTIGFPVIQSKQYRWQAIG